MLNLIRKLFGLPEPEQLVPLITVEPPPCDDCGKPAKWVIFGDRYYKCQACCNGYEYRRILVHRE